MEQRIVWLERGIFASVVNIRRPSFPHILTEHQFTPHSDFATIVQRLEGATIVIDNRVPITAELLDACPTVKLIAAAATGYDMIDVRACKDRGVDVCNIRDWSVSIPEHVFALILSLQRQLPKYTAAVARGAWTRHDNPLLVYPPMPHTLAGSTMGIIGLGVLAKRVVTLATAFSMSVLVAERKGVAEPRPGRTTFESVLRQSDVVVILCPLVPETRNLFGATELACMKSTALLINCARGGIVDEAALAAAVRSGTIGGVGMDVMTEEPPRSGGPLLDLAAEGCERLLITPHVAWASHESLEVLVEQLIGNLEAWVEGRPRNLVGIDV